MCDSGQGIVYDREISLSPGLSTPNALFYYCVAHTNMGGPIRITGGTSTACAPAGSGELANVEPGATPELGARMVVARSRLIVAHAFMMYGAFGLLLPVAAFMAHIGRTLKLGGGNELSVHKFLAPFAVLVGCAGVALAIAGIEREGQARAFPASNTVRFLPQPCQPLLFKLLTPCPPPTAHPLRSRRTLPTLMASLAYSSLCWRCSCSRRLC